MKIHFIGIGGIGVSALAQYYLAKEHKITGSDLLKSEITDLLKKKGAKIIISNITLQQTQGDAEQSRSIKNQKSKTQIKIQNFIKQSNLVIYSPAVPKNHFELKEVKKLGIKRQSYPEALGELTKKYFTIAVCGTHGNSTVTAMLSLILIKAGLDPTVILGTKLKEFGNSNFRMGGTKNHKLKTNNYLLIEADEWQASFLNYWPKIIVVTNIEREHLDYYKDLRHILRTYKEFISHLPKEGILITSKNLKGVEKLRKTLKVPGKHNLSNALLALKTAQALKIPDKISLKALSEYKGAWRRFETFNCSIKNYKLRTINYKLIFDYAHHPTEIKATLKTARQMYPKRKIWCIFQPHQYQRTFYLFNDFVKTFKKAPIDKLIITDIYDVAGREVRDIEKKVNSKKLIEAIGKPWTIYLPKIKIINYLKKSLKGGEVVIVMGAGDIYKLCEQF